MPLQIDKGQVDRQKRLVKVEPHNAAGPQQSLGKTNRPNYFIRGMGLESHIHYGKNHGDNEKRRGPQPDPAVSAGRSHQMMPKSSTGMIATDPLPSIANKNAARLNQYQ